MYKTIYTEVEVDVNLSEFDTDDLIEELESRGITGHTDSNELLESIWLKRRMGQDYSVGLVLMIFTGIVKII